MLVSFCPVCGGALDVASMSDTPLYCHRCASGFSVSDTDPPIELADAELGPILFVRQGRVFDVDGNELTSVRETAVRHD